MSESYEQSVAERDEYLTGSVISRDGTVISYGRLGHGPGIIILHGSMSTGFYHFQLAKALSEHFTVYLPDRRGFGRSGPADKEDGILEDVEDLDALLSETGANTVFGVSTGGIIALKAALRLSSIRRLAVYEPPLFEDSSVPLIMMKRFDEEISRGDVAAALTTVMKGAPLISDLVGLMPRWLVRFMTKKTMAFKVSNDYASFEELAPTLHHDGQTIIEMSGRQRDLSDLQCDVLLLGGGKSTRFLKTAFRSVVRVMPAARVTVLAGLNHGSAWNSEVRGRPGPIADELLRFMS